MKTSVSTNHPVISELRKDVEAKFAHPLASLTNFEQLVSDVEYVTHEHLNAYTLRRLWGLRHDNYDSVRLTTLNILSKYTGASDWEAYCEYVRKEKSIESDTTSQMRIIHSSDLHTGDEFVVCWQPNRVCRLRYEGDNIWFVVEVEQSHTLCNGDILVFSEIIEGETLVASLNRDGKTLGAVRLGIDNGVRFE